MCRILLFFTLLAACTLPQLQAQTFPITVRVSVARLQGANRSVIDKTVFIQSWAELDKIFTDNKIQLDAEELADLHLSGDNTKMSIIHTNAEGVDEYIITVRRMLGEGASTEIPEGFFKVRLLVSLPAKGGMVLIDKTLIIKSWEELDKVLTDNSIPLGKDEIQNLHLSGDKTKVTVIHSNAAGVDEYTVTVQKVTGDEKQWTPVSSTTTTTLKADGNQ